MPGHRYTATSDEARALGLELLRLSAIYDGPTLPHGYGAERMAVVAAVVRARRLMISATALADRGDALEAALLTRSILEIAFTLGWLKKDPELGVLIWMLDEERSTLSQHEQYSKEERKRRRAARRAGEHVPAVAASKTIGLLDRSTLYHRRKSERELDARIRALPRLKRRLRRLRPQTYKPGRPVKTKLINRLPGFDERAAVAGLFDLYALIYRFESRAAVHPNLLSVEQFLEAREEGVVVHAEPQRRRLDPYAIGAAVLGLVLEFASEQLDDFDLQADVAALLPRTASLRTGD
jgi:hypothetical protein